MSQQWERMEQMLQAISLSLQSSNTRLDQHEQALVHHKEAEARQQEEATRQQAELAAQRERMAHQQALLTSQRDSMTLQQENLVRQQADIACQREDLLRHTQHLQQLDQRGAAQHLPEAPVPHSSADPRVSQPHRYDGSKGGCRGFLTQCDLIFELQPRAFSSDRFRIAYIITLLTDKALKWATAVWAKQGSVCSSFKDFQEEMLLVFDQSTTGPDAAKLLMTIRQDKRSVTDYAIEFRTLAEESEWNDKALVTAFHHGLSDALKDGLASIGCPRELEPLIAHAVRLDNRMRERRGDQGVSWLLPASSGRSKSSDDPEPMQLGGARLSAKEKERRMREGLCLYCGETGHRLSSCLELSGKGVVRPTRGGL